MKVALVHDWLIHMRGGEKVLESLAEMYPDAVIYTLFCNRKNLSEPLQRLTIRTSFIQYIPFHRKIYRWLLPIMPFAIQTLRIEPDTQLVISSSHCVAKGIRIPVNAKHICYCHTPMRYAWGFSREYFGRYFIGLRFLINLLLKPLRYWDNRSNKSIDMFIANSANVQSRIAKLYGRDSKVVHPPADRDFFKPGGTQKDYYLVVSAFVPYKRVDLVIEAFNSTTRKLFIVGSGPLEARYRKLRKSPQIYFLGSLKGEELRNFYAEAKALIFPTDEDFGIVPVEAQACGTPVIAFGRGGALESVKTGIFFQEQTAEAILKALQEFEGLSYDRTRISQSVQEFGKPNFKANMKRSIDKALGRAREHVTR